LDPTNIDRDWQGKEEGAGRLICLPWEPQTVSLRIGAAQTDIDILMVRATADLHIDQFPCQTENINSKPRHRNHDGHVVYFDNNRCVDLETK
jgi:hypothetical protein